MSEIDELYTAIKAVPESQQRSTAMAWVDWWNELAYYNDFLNDCPDPDALLAWFYGRLCLLFEGQLVEGKNGRWVVLDGEDYRDRAKGFTAHETTISFLRGV